VGVLPQRFTTSHQRCHGDPGFDLYKTHIWAVLFNIVVGVWIAVSPWLVQTMPDRVMSASLLFASPRSC
jgi:hypothetical protein